MALARASLILSKILADNDDQRFGIEIVRKAIQTPLRQIAEKPEENGPPMPPGGGMGDMDF